MAEGGQGPRPKVEPVHSCGVNRRSGWLSSFASLTSPRTVAAVGALMAAAGLVLLFMGRIPICRCGYV